MKPMLASDADLKKISFPCLVQPKIDGVRALYLNDQLTGRSLKPHKNKHLAKTFNHIQFKGFDGEMTAMSDPAHPDLCRTTSSALGTYEGEPYLKWWLFDYINSHTKILPYKVRLELLREQLDEYFEIWPDLRNFIQIVDTFYCATMDDLLSFEEDFLDLGYEGLIIRDPEGRYKEGRSTIREGGLLRLKRFIDAEAVVEELTEGETNLNEKQTNELGKSFRTSHQSNKVTNGMIGNLLCRVHKDIFDIQGNLLFKAGYKIVVSPGSMDHQKRTNYWENQNLIIGKVIKFKFFPKGIKDQPRFPTYLSIREDSDL
jgi:DNA ligase-1